MAIYFFMGRFVLKGMLFSLRYRDAHRRRGLGAKLTSETSKKILGTFGVVVKKKGPLPSHKKGQLIVANHHSYLDVLVLSSLFPCVFITSVETQQDSFLGRLSSLGGSLFVERRNHGRLKRDIEQVRCVLALGYNVVLFPEATSGNGEKLLPFRAVLLKAAEKLGAHVVPVHLGYERINGQPLTRENRDLIFWYGSMTFFPHFMKLLASVKSLSVTVTFGEPLRWDESVSGKVMAERAREQIVTHFKPL